MILVTGGCGYIGSHCVIKLLNQGYEVIILDNLTNSTPDAINKINQITNIPNKFIEGDIRDENLLDKIFAQNKISAVLHFAGLKSISESFKKPLDYYSTNLKGSINLFQSMKKAKINKLIFSSSATVYGSGHSLPWHEELEIKIPENPYAKSKYFVEEILKNISLNESDWSIGILRYFNPIGSHESGVIGDSTSLESGNLIPSIARVLIGKSTHLKIFGADYNTCDGTGIRDYVHVNDLSDGHLRALKYIDLHKGFNIWNLGTGRGYSVFEIIKTFENLMDKKIPYKIYNRRKGDLPEYWADVSKANRELKWYAESDIKQMAKDTLKYINKLKVKK